MLKSNKKEYLSSLLFRLEISQDIYNIKNHVTTFWEDFNFHDWSTILKNYLKSSYIFNFKIKELEYQQRKRKALSLPCKRVSASLMTPPFAIKVKVENKFCNVCGFTGKHMRSSCLKISKNWINNVQSRQWKCSS